MKVLTIRVQPSSKRDEVTLTGNDSYDVSTPQSAKEGKANKQVIKNLARYLHTSPSQLIVSKGEKWNEKTILWLD